MVDAPLFGRQNDPFAAAGRSLPRNLLTQPTFERTTSGNDDPFKALDELNDQLTRREKENQLLKSSNEFGIALANINDKNLAIHQATLRIQYTLKCGLVAYFRHAAENQRLELFFPFGPEIGRLRDKLGERWERYWHSLTGGLIGRTTRSGKIQISYDPDPTLELLHAGSRPFVSLMAAPVMVRGTLEGVLLLADTRPNYFDALDAVFTQDICSHFSAALGRISFTEHEQLVVNATTEMVETRDTGEILARLAELTLQTTGARMAIAAIYEETDWKMRAAGQIDHRLLKDLSGLSGFFRFVSSQTGPLPLQDLRSNEAALKLDIEDATLRAALACPFRLSDYVSAQEGVLLALGKDTGPHFTAADEALIHHLAINAALALDANLSKNDVRETAERSQRALKLSLDIARSTQLDQAARRMLVDAKSQFSAITAGLVLVDEQDEILVKIGLPDDLPDEGLEDLDLLRVTHPMEKIFEAIRSGAHQVVPLADTLKKVFPIKTQERCYGALWLEVPIRGGPKTHHDEDIRILINQTAVALESSIRNAKIRDQLNELNNAYSALTETHRKLEQSHNQLSENFLETIRSLMSALEEREKETAEHTKRMEKVVMRIGTELRLNRDEMHNLRYGAILHDIGKIGVSDLILLKEGNLTDAERKQMEKHAETGARIVGNIPGLAGAAEVIANHHELWNGTGYPHGLSERMIPLLARIVTVADVFDALTHDRPYRDRLPVSEAIAYMRRMAGVIYDPELIEILVRVLPDLASEIDITLDEIPA